ncbi:MAG TPA: DUF3999 family protein [Methylomirabilota bacterium]|nr:DUF3999 family protein [Methylomirabilota bacterium]
MKRRTWLPGLLICVIAASAVAANLPDPWRAWRYSRSFPPGKAGERLELLLPEEVLQHSENHLDDLRVVDDRGAEVPYVIVADRALASGAVRKQVTLREKSFVRGQFTQIILDTGPQPAFHNRAALETPATEFMHWVQVDASDDALAWRILRQRAPISRVTENNITSNQTIRYSDTNARYLRLRVLGTSEQFPVTGAAVWFMPETREPAKTRIHAVLVPDPSVAPALTRWNAELGSSDLRVIEIVFESAQREFFRAVRVFRSEDSKEWEFVSGGQIYRFYVGDKVEEDLRVPVFPGAPARYWRVEIMNKNDAPLVDVRANLRRLSLAVLMIPEAGRTYRLLYGNARAGRPEYDLAKTLPSNMTQVLDPQDLAFGLEEATSNYTDPRPFSERHPNLLWLALGVAVILLAYSAMRSLRSAPAKSSGSDLD